MQSEFYIFGKRLIGLLLFGPYHFKINNLIFFSINSKPNIDSWSFFYKTGPSCSTTLRSIIIWPNPEHTESIINVHPLLKSKTGSNTLKISKIFGTSPPTSTTKKGKEAHVFKQDLLIIRSTVLCRLIHSNHLWDPRWGDWRALLERGFETQNSRHKRRRFWCALRCSISSIFLTSAQSSCLKGTSLNKAKLWGENRRAAKTDLMIGGQNLLFRFL